MSIEPYSLYKKLLSHFGKQNWWPVDGKDGKFEIIVGAILTQNTAWRNVERAIKNLKKNNLLSIEGILNIEKNKLKNIIRPAGFYNQKAGRLKTFVEYLSKNYNKNLDLFLNRSTNKVRRDLLSIKGIGFETADSILLYAGNHPIFVVDAYTKRLCSRLPVKEIKDTNSYEEIRRFFEEGIKKNVSDKLELIDVYKELHALIVKLAKTYCKKKPYCEECPLGELCAFKS
jgi:endonuclease-3 related protein